MEFKYVILYFTYYIILREQNSLNHSRIFKALFLYVIIRNKNLKINT